MNKFLLRPILLAALVTFIVLAGCKKNSPNPVKEPDDETTTPTKPKEKNPLGGICPTLLPYMTDYELNTFLTEYEKTNGLYVRMDLPWSVIQPTGKDSWNFGPYDRAINALTAHGFKVLPIVTYCPAWANGGYSDDKYPPTPEHAIDWYNFVKACADRYIPKGVDAWELWNEPNITAFWKPVCDVEAYTNIVLKNGYNAVKASATALNKNVTVISGGLAAAASNGRDIHPMDFLKGIYEEGGKEFMDAVGHHPYCFPESPASTVEWSLFQMTPRIHQIMVDNGDGNKKIWGTEFGYHTGYSVIGGVSEAKQAEYITLAYKLWAQWEYTGPLCWYNYIDLGTNMNDREQKFGLKLYNGTNKPAWQAYINALK
ncbi:hypothetical protein EOD41_02930 [Mucilaginibacter limnophilus]|uniref:Glycoside hydrolase family 5 domain-containing protein n=1 Tax=Mucilaginibacter limnophilus TaxID=1932778 RepID=A0A3S2V438_9SPHI|nr:hypothetical protein [Mucilaginibacter limnophilus]RVU02909.1 hypothetical protein EOD41_02930 [Mucilaginibacter limnophilus]